MHIRGGLRKGLIEGEDKNLPVLDTGVRVNSHRYNPIPLAWSRYGKVSIAIGPFLIGRLRRIRYTEASEIRARKRSLISAQYMTLDVPIRVRYAETDAMGVAYHGHYFTWFEVARVELMRAMGLRYRDLETEGIYLPVVECRAQFLSAARYDASLQIRTALMAASRAKVVFGYEVRETEGSSLLLARGQTTHAFTGRQGRATRLPQTHPLWQGMRQAAYLPEFVSFA